MYSGLLFCAMVCYDHCYTQDFKMLWSYKNLGNLLILTMNWVPEC